MFSFGFCGELPLLRLINRDNCFIALKGVYTCREFLTPISWLRVRYIFAVLDIVDEHLY